MFKTSKIRLFLFPYANGNVPPKPIASQEEKKAFPFAFFIYYLKQCDFILLTLNRSQAAAYKDVKTRADQLALTAKRLPGHLQESTVDSLPLNDCTCQRQPVSLNCHPLTGYRVTNQGRGASGVHSAQEYVTQQRSAQPYIRQPSTELTFYWKYREFTSLQWESLSIHQPYQFHPKKKTAQKQDRH